MTVHPDHPTAGTPPGRLPAQAGLARRIVAGQAGSVVTEYGLIAVIGATIAGLAIQWASGGAIFDLFGAIMSRVQAVVGA